MADRTHAQTPVATQAPAQEAPASTRNGGRGNAARQEELGTAAPPEAPSPQAAVVRQYAERLWERIGELVSLQDPKEKTKQARGLLGQAVRVHDAVRMGEPVQVELLPRFPEPDATAYPLAAFPPEWVRPARMLLEMAGGTGAPDAAAQTPGATHDGLPSDAGGMFAKLQSLGREPADYGVNGYQTQSDNLASPEATCNGTSLAMVLERLGYTRDDLVQTITNLLKKQQLTQQLRRQGVPESDIPKRVAEADLSCVFLADTQWQARVRLYLDQENRRGSNYQRPRGSTATPGEVDRWSKVFKDQAGIDDLALLLMSMLGIDRTAVNSGNNPQKLVDQVQTVRGGAAPTTEHIDSGRGWARTKPIVKQVLDEGGAAMISVRHKGAGQSGTHIVAIQAVTEDGLLVDDPYGRQRDDYRASRRGDAYALPGHTRGNSGLRNQVDPDRDDWKRSSTRTQDETRGESNTWADEKVRDMWNYVQLFRRGGTNAAATNPAADTTAGTQARPAAAATPAR